MFTLRKLHPPFGTRDAPVHEGSYSEGIIRVVDGFCSVKNRDSRDYLLKMGYVEMPESGAAPIQEAAPKAAAVVKPAPGAAGKFLSRLKGKGRR